MPDYEILHKGFEENRTQKGKIFQDFVIQSIKDIGFLAYPSGIETILKNVHDKIIFSDDSGSLFLRFFPDIIALIGNPPRALFVEAKASHTIEKTAWEQYQFLASIGLDVVLVTGESNNEICNINGWNFVENIKLYTGEYTVKDYVEENRFPVIDDWVSPRASERFNSMQSLSLSGAPYREINTSSLLPWELFTRIVFARYDRKG